MKHIIKTIFGFALILLTTQSAYAARMYLSPASDAFKEGCGNTVNIMVDTEGADSNAADAVLSYDPNQIEVTALSNGSIYQTYLGHSYTGGAIRLSAFSVMSSFNGNGKFASFVFKGKAGVTDANINFSFVPGSTTDSNVADLSSNDILSSVGNGSYTFSAGPCFPDSQPPQVVSTSPSAGETGVALDSDVIVRITDNQAGVNLDTVVVRVDGVDYTRSGGNAFQVSGSALDYTLTVNPLTDFTEGQQVDVRVEAADADSNVMSPYNFYFNKPVVDTRGPYVQNMSPANNATGIPLDTNISFNILDDDPGVDIDTVQVTVEGTSYTKDRFSFTGDPANYAVTVDPATDLPADKRISVRVQASDLDGHAMTYTSGFNEAPPPPPPTCEELGCPQLECPAPPPSLPSGGAGCTGYPLAEEVLRPAAEELPDELTEETFERKKEECAGYSDEEDSDRDGLIDHTECYLGTDAFNADTDGDSCTDGDEVNRFESNPLFAGDCKAGVATRQNVIITDPQNGWVVPELNIAGLTPSDTVSVSAFLYRANVNAIQEVRDALESLKMADTSDSGTLKRAVAGLLEAIRRSDAFLSDSRGEDNAAFGALIASLENQALNLKTAINAASDDIRIDLDFEGVTGRLDSLLKNPETLGIVGDFSEAKVSGRGMRHFSFDPVKGLENNTYDLIVKAKLEDGRELTSQPVRFHLDDGAFVSAPVPLTLGGVIVSKKPGKEAGIRRIRFEGVDVSDVESGEDGSGEIIIQNRRPAVTGLADFGSRVFAVWNSDVYESSTVADSKEGFFAIQAPKNLETDVGHTVRLYAIRQMEGASFRSENVTLNFRIEPEGFAWKLVLLLAIILVILIIARKKLQSVLHRIKHQKQKGDVVGKLVSVYQKTAGKTKKIIKTRPEKPKS